MYKEDLMKVQNYVKASYDYIDDSKTQYEKDLSKVKKYVSKMNKSIEYKKALDDMFFSMIDSVKYYADWQDAWDVEEVKDLYRFYLKIVR